MTLRPDINKLVDHRNEALWQHVSKHKVVTLQFHRHAYQVNMKNGEALFLIRNNEYCIDSFTHELLHADISIREIYIYAHLCRMLKGNVLLSEMFSDDLLSHIGNVLEHVKMLPKYLELGFDRTKFIDDYYKVKCTVKELSLIALYYRSNRGKWVNGVDMFLGKYFAMRACPNTGIKYQDCYDQLETIDPHLLQILDDFWHSWLAHDIGYYDVIDNNYHDVLDNFYYSLIGWAQLNHYRLP